MADWDNPRIITVTGINDSIADGEQAYLIDLAVTDGEAAYLALTIDSIPAINSDDDTVGATVSPRSLIISETEPLNPNGGMQLCPKNLADGQTFPQCSSFRVRLNTQPTAVVTFPVTNSDPIQMSVSRTTLQFSPADWATNQSVTVCGVDDGIDDSLATAMVMIGLGVSSDVGYSGYNPPDVGVTIVENCDKPL